MQNDLTVGKPFRVILAFSLPLLLSTALQQVYNITDSIIVGQYTGAPGLAAIGAAYPITLFYIAIATGGGMGCSVVISQLFGAKKLADMKSAIFTSIIALSVLGVVLAGAGMLLSGDLMTLLNVSDTHHKDATGYLFAYSVGVFPMLVYNATTATFTGLGDSRTPLYLLLMSSLLNVVLDIIAVGPLEWGVVGAAYATSVSQAVAAILSVLLLVKRLRRIHTEGMAYRHFDPLLLRKMARIALPSIFQQACVALTHSIVQSLVNSFDTAVMAGYEAASKLHNFAYMSFNTLGTALSSFTAQCYGAGKRGRILEGFRVSTLLCLGCTVVVILLFQLLPGQLVGLFVDAAGATEAEAIEVGIHYLRIISPVYLVICFIITVGGLLRGIGKSMTFFVETVLEFIVRVVMCFVLTKALSSYTGLLWAWYFGSSCGFIMCLGIYRYTVRRGALAPRLDGAKD